MDICFHFLALMNNAAINIHVQFVWTYVFGSLGYIPKSEIAGSYGDYMFNFLSNCKIVFQISIPFTFPSALYKGSSFTTSSTMLVFIHLFFYCSHPSGCEVILIFISLMTHDTEKMLRFSLLKIQYKRTYVHRHTHKHTCTQTHTHIHTHSHFLQKII